MAANRRETAVKTVRVSVKRLQEALSKNLETHKVEFREAWEGYESARHDLMVKLKGTTEHALESNTSENRQAIHGAYGEYTRLERPRNHADSYEQAIALMEWEEREEIELSVNDFECYVRDNWDWTGTFKSAHAHYNASGHSHSI